MSELVAVAYDGPIAELEVTDPRAGGRTLGTVKSGESIDVPKHVADDLVQREDFSLATKAKPAPVEAQKDVK